jgi:hypothetical protein
MRLFVIFLLLSLSGAEAPAEDRAARPESGEGGHFGAPVIKYTTIRNQGAVMFGGRGGWNGTPFLVVGGGLYGTMTEVNAPQDGVPDAPGPLDVKLYRKASGVEQPGLEDGDLNGPAAVLAFKLGRF